MMVDSAPSSYNTGMNNLHLTVETLERVKFAVKAEQKANPKPAKTTDGKPSVYWPRTKPGTTGMVKTPAQRKNAENDTLHPTKDR